MLACPETLKSSPQLTERPWEHGKSRWAYSGLRSQGEAAPGSTISLADPAHLIPFIGSEVLHHAAYKLVLSPGNVAFDNTLTAWWDVEIEAATTLIGDCCLESSKLLLPAGFAPRQLCFPGFFSEVS